MGKIKVNMLSMADSVPGQGVGSAYLDQLNLLKEDKSNSLEIMINSKEVADIVHFHTIDLKNYFKMNFVKGKKVVSVHFLTDTLEGALKIPKIFMAIFKKYLKSFYKKADYIAAINPYIVDELVSYGIPKEKIHIIPNYASESNFFSTDKLDEDVLKKYDVDKSKKIILGVGQIVHRKGILDFINIAKKIPDIEFFWCGGFFFGSHTENYQELKDAYNNPPKNVHFLGKIPREDMNIIYNACDIFFNPSYKETFSMTTLEASKVHKPLLMRQLPEHDGVFFDKYIKCDNNESFIKEITKLLMDKSYYNQAVSNSKYISDYYSKESVLKKWLEFYQNIVKN